MFPSLKSISFEKLLRVFKFYYSFELQTSYHIYFKLSSIRLAQNSWRIEIYLIKISTKCLQELLRGVLIKIKVSILTIWWKSGWVEGSLNLEILRGGEAQAVLVIGVEEGGVKKGAFRRGSVDFHRYNPFLICLVQCLWRVINLLSHSMV